MAPTYRAKDGLLAKVNFPLYTVQMLTGRHILVGGGGGSSKTGVANGFEVFELSHDGKKFIAEEVIRHETGPCVVMNCSTHSDMKHSYLVAGQESHCQLYHVRNVVLNENENIETINGEQPNLRHRKNSKPILKQTVANSKQVKKLTFILQASDSIQTDYNKEEPLQRVVRISKNGKVMATGGADGIVRLWKFPAMEHLIDLKAHTKEIDDLDFSLHDNYLVSIAKDGQAIIWDFLRGKEVRKLLWPQPEGSKFLYKRCRFGPIEEEKGQSALYMLTNPLGLAKNQNSYLQRWFPHEGTLNKAVAIDESLAAIAVRDDGRFVAVGTMFSGSVQLYVAFSLQKVLHISGAHSMFVTGLEFLPVSHQHTVTSVAEAAVVSISVDNQICIHSLPYRTTVPAWIAISVIVVTLFLTFLLCAYLGI
ncbi:prolactin regulatory element binding protein [Holotrichia oblita]|uniref:Prolactin regulatory element binding protein n=1 Tax=Holotrichia oblita TaxID=644536 RepID=A0ACB9TDE7_HOLOL|nr:prolactin regulatory element binding protein [Holotrichia oblita]